MNLIRCDRCNREVEPFNAVRYQDTRKNNIVDLCFNCDAALQNWIKEQDTK